jgi:hypothetical protein
MSIEEVHDRAEKRRLAAIDDILRKYQSLAPHLIMIEKARPQPPPPAQAHRALRRLCATRTRAARRSSPSTMRTGRARCSRR